MGTNLDIKALTAEIKATVDAAFDSRLKTAVESATKPIVDRVTDLEAKGRERPSLFTGKDDAGQPFFKGVAMKPLYEGGRYKGKFDIPNMSPREIADFKFIGVLRGLKTGKWDGFGLEKAVFDEVAKQKAALQLGDDAAAGFYIPNQLMDIIDPLRAEAAYAQIGAQMLTGLTSSPVEIPRQVGVETAYMVGEDTAITESNQTADMIRLSPHMAAVLTKASGSLLQKEPGIVEGRIRKSIELTLQLKKDQQIFEGTGVAPNVLGTANMSGINTVSFSGVDSSTVWGKIQQMIRELEVDNVMIGNAKFVMHAQAWHALWNYQIARIAAGNLITFLTISDGANGVPQKKLMGYPVVICNTLTASTTTILQFLNGPEIMVASWLNPGIAFSEHYEFNKFNGAFRIVEEFDVNAEHPESVCTGTAFTY